MALQHWFTAASTVAMPYFAAGFGGAAGSAQQLRRLFWQEPAGMLVGQFQLEAGDYSLTAQAGGDLGASFGRAILLKLWRDGSVVQWPLLTQQQGFFYTVTAGGFGFAYPEAALIQTNDGRVARGIGNQTGGPQPNYNDLLAAADPPAGIYEMDRLWTGDMHKTRLGAVGWISAHNVGLLFPTKYQALRFHYPYPFSAGVFEVWETSAGGSTLRLTHSITSDNSYRHARDILVLGSSTIGLLFRQSQTGAASTTPDTSVPALLRVYDTTTSAYTLLWEDTLPGTDAVAAYDANRQILYSAPKFPPITLHASRPKRAPTYILGPSLTSDTVLRSLGATTVQVRVQDAYSVNLSTVLVQWSLTSQMSGGFLTSAYGLTNTTGVAFTTYAGPFLSGALTETLSATVATVE